MSRLQALRLTRTICILIAIVVAIVLLTGCTNPAQKQAEQELALAECRNLYAGAPPADMAMIRYKAGMPGSPMDHLADVIESAKTYCPDAL